MYNSRGQLNDIVKVSVENGHRDELFFKAFIEKTYKKQLIGKSQYKHYDFAVDKLHKIEYKGLHYTLNIDTNIATSSIKDKHTAITNVFIGLDKIIYYHCRKRKNKSLRFYIFYGFIQSSDNTVNKITYKYIEITDVLFQMIMEYPKQYYYNKEHVLIPISSLKELNECPLFIQ
jgi:hypothetical protein